MKRPRLSRAAVAARARPAHTCWRKPCTTMTSMDNGAPSAAQSLEVAHTLLSVAELFLSVMIDGKPLGNALGIVLSGRWFLGSKTLKTRPSQPTPRGARLDSEMREGRLAGRAGRLRRRGPSGARARTYSAPPRSGDLISLYGKTDQVLLSVWKMKRRPGRPARHLAFPVYSR